ncbi:MAG: AbrB/MazE/SpoVT family DNA-binding domain-containing protein [Chloroflexi bacterium]|nr:AbrB/MazE/SpoVT family DNA-binding domain-containing protein [Chloroflexota bacterium]
MAAVKVSAKGWIVIPKELREKYGLTPGRQVEIVDYAGVLSIVPVSDDPIDALYGMFADLGGPSWTEELLKERREEFEREERRYARLVRP